MRKAKTVKFQEATASRVHPHSGRGCDKPDPAGGGSEDTGHFSQLVFTQGHHIKVVS